jgi:hypothetical protein
MSGVLVIIFRYFLIAATMLQLGTSATDSTSGLLKTKLLFRVLAISDFIPAAVVSRAIQVSQAYLGNFLAISVA